MKCRSQLMLQINLPEYSYYLSMHRDLGKESLSSCVQETGGLLMLQTA